MTIHIEIDTDNDAFQDGRLLDEVGSILLRLLNEWDPLHLPMVLPDRNGNTVGKVWAS